MEQLVRHRQPKGIDDDGDTPVHKQQRHRITAWYDAPDASSRWMHVVPLGFVDGTDGLSGSPVFVKHTEKWSFAGVLTRAGGVSWSWGRFVHAELLLYLINKAWSREHSGTHETG